MRVLIVLLLLLLKYRWIAINDSTSDGKLVFVLRSNIIWFSNARIHQILLAHIWVSMRMLLWWCNYHRTIMMHIIIATKVLVLRLIPTICWIWTQRIFQSIEEFRILLRVASRSCIGASASYIWTVRIIVLLSTSIAIFSVLKARHTTDLVKISISWPKLIDDYATYDRLKMRILEYI